MGSEHLPGPDNGNSQRSAYLAAQQRPGFEGRDLKKATVSNAGETLESAVGFAWQGCELPVQGKTAHDVIRNRLGLDVANAETR